MFIQTFKHLATVWKYQGVSEIEFEFIGDVDLEFFLMQVSRTLERATIEDAEGYMAVVLRQATLPGVGKYTLTGK